MCVGEIPLFERAGWRGEFLSFLRRYRGGGGGKFSNREGECSRSGGNLRTAF